MSTLDEINKLATYETNLTDVINAKFIEWMLQGKEVSDSQWSEFQSKLEKAGVEKIKEINQAGYDRYLASQGK